MLATSLPHSTRFITYTDEYPALRNWLRPDAAVRYMLEDKDVFRVLPLTNSSFYNRNYLPIFGIETANGFYDNRIRYYETLTGAGQENLVDPKVMSLTNVKYVITGGRVNHPSLVLDQTFGQTLVYRNKDFLPRAFIVHEAVVAPERLGRPGNHPRAPASIRPRRSCWPRARRRRGSPRRAACPRARSGPGSRPTTPDKVVVRARAAGPGYLYFSENYLPYWKARVDGRPASLVRCNVAMRAIPIEAGRAPDRDESTRRDGTPSGVVLFLLSCLVVAAGVIGCWVWPRLRSKHA